MLFQIDRSILSRVATVRARRRRARHLGFRFKRAARFQLPYQIRINDECRSLRSPNDNGTRTAFIDVLLDDCYLLESFPCDLRTVLDIGSHVGFFSLAARNRWPNAIIHGYEPNEGMLKYLSTQAEAADFLIFPEAVGFDDGLVSVDVCPDSVQTRVHRDSAGSVRLTPFSEAISRLGGSVDLVKLDCEGGEWEILNDADAWQNVRYLTMEYHLWAGYSVTHLESRLAELGFLIGSQTQTGPDFGLLTAYRN